MIPSGIFAHFSAIPTSVPTALAADRSIALSVAHSSPGSQTEVWTMFDGKVQDTRSVTPPPLSKAERHAIATHSERMERELEEEERLMEESSREENEVFRQIGGEV